MKLLRRPATLLLSAALAGASLPLAAPLASAAGHDGYCQDAAGTTVVVDFQALGGGVVIRCATSLPSGATGLDALRAAGVPYQGVLRYGDAFICRLYGRPAATTALPVRGSAGYHEQCIDTPPTAAYWSYWSASNGGRWTYSSYGVRNRAAIRGGFEGWSFSLNAAASGAPPPRVAPTRPAAPSPTSSARATTHPPVATASRPAGAAHTSSRASAAASASSAAAPTTTSTATASTSASASASGSRARPSTGSVPLSTSTRPGHTSTRPRPGRTSSSTTAGPAAPAGPSSASSSTGGLVVSSSSLGRPAPPAPTSPATVVGAGLLAFLVAAAAGTAWRRRRAP